MKTQSALATQRIANHVVSAVKMLVIDLQLNYTLPDMIGPFIN